jgi:chaperone modulatory protein CbpM
MTQEKVQWHGSDSLETITLTELSHCCGMSEAELDELVEYCALLPISPATPERIFSAQWVVPLRNAAKLRVDYDLDLFTVAIVLDKLTRIEILERQVHSLQAQLPSHLRSDMGC